MTQKIVFSFIILSIFSCQKEINIDLNSSNPRVVIDAGLQLVREYKGLDTFYVLNNMPYSGYLAKVNRTASLIDSFNDPNLVIKNAFITISDKYGNIDTLQYSNGYYNAKKGKLHIKPEFGSSYKMDVVVNGTKYSATSSCPAHVDIDTVIFKQIQTILGWEKQCEIDFTDPVSIENYYCIFVDSTYGANLYPVNLEVYNDQFFNGKKMKCIDNLGYGNFSNVSHVMLYSIDKANYDFYRSLITLTRNNVFLSESPSNPISNFNNGAIGHFSICYISFKNF